MSEFTRKIKYESGTRGRNIELNLHSIRLFLYEDMIYGLIKSSTRGLSEIIEKWDLRNGAGQIVVPFAVADDISRSMEEDIVQCRF